MSELEKYNWESHVETNIFILKIIGLWPLDKFGFYTIYSFITVSFFIVIYLSGHIINAFLVCDNLEAFVAVTYILLIECMGGIKIYYLLKHAKLLKLQMAKMRSDLFQPKSPNQIVMIESSIRIWKLTYKFFLISAILCNLFWAIYPLVDKSEERRLPFVSWYPYDATATPFYEITYVYQVISCNYISLAQLNADTLISGLNVYCGCQIDILCDNLRNFATPGEEEVDAYQKLLSCIRHHKEILNFVEGWTNCFNWIIFWHLLISGVSIGITMFQLTLVVPLSNEFYSLLSFGFAITIQIFMYCGFGNEVTVKSDNLPYALFESDWTHLPIEVQKVVLFFMMNISKPVRIYANEVFQLSLDTFMKILKTAWSYFALLYQLGSSH